MAKQPRADEALSTPEQGTLPTVPESQQGMSREFLDKMVKKLEDDNESMRCNFAYAAFKIIVSKQVESGKFEHELAGTWCWKYADSAMKAMKVVPAQTVMARGVVAKAEPIWTEPEPILNPVQQQILDQSNPKFDPASALLSKP